MGHLGADFGYHGCGGNDLIIVGVNSGVPLPAWVVQLDKDLRAVFVDCIDQPLQALDISCLRCRQLPGKAPSPFVVDTGYLCYDQSTTTPGPFFIVTNNIRARLPRKEGQSRTHGRHDYPVLNRYITNFSGFEKLFVCHIPSFLPSIFFNAAAI